jgi:hypothetical protein
MLIMLYEEIDFLNTIVYRLTQLNALKLLFF